MVNVTPKDNPEVLDSRSQGLTSMLFVLNVFEVTHKPLHIEVSSVEPLHIIISEKSPTWFSTKHKIKGPTYFLFSWGK